MLKMVIFGYEPTYQVTSTFSEKIDNGGCHLFSVL
jgi:hypothetical protein